MLGQKYILLEMRYRKFKYIIAAGILVPVISIFFGGVSANPMCTKKPSNQNLIYQQQGLPIKPQSCKWLFEHSDLIAYVEIISVDKKTNDSIYKKQPPGIYPSFGEQYCQANVLKILKGLTELKNKTITVIKRKSRYYLKEKQKLVLYLEKQNEIYQTIDLFGGEHRLASALCNINELRKDVQKGGIVVTVLNKKEDVSFRIHIIRGRQKVDINIGDKIWRNYLLKILDIDEFDTIEVPLGEGNYTVLLEIDHNLYPHSRLIDGYYPYVIITKGKWKPLYFDIDKIKR